jgi:hypothetical protein
LAPTVLNALMRTVLVGFLILVLIVLHCYVLGLMLHLRHQQQRKYQQQAPPANARQSPMQSLVDPPPTWL